LAARDQEWWTQVIGMLSAQDWRVRQSAAEILAAAGTEYFLQAVPQIIAAMNDQRGLDSFPARIAAAELLLNDYRYSAQALETIVPALDYGAHPLGIVPDAGEVRKQAALALGKLKADYRQPHVFARLERFPSEETDPELLDGAFIALLSLAAAPELE
jgi:HEAT repeat protein